MFFFFNATGYPHHEPDGQQLHLALSQLYPSGRAAALVAQRAQLDGGMIFFEQAPFLVWKDILDLANREGKLEDVVRIASGDFPRSPWHALFAALIDGKPTHLEHEPRSADGQAVFLHNSDQVSVPESLLFYDDLTVAAGQLPAMIAALQRIAKMMPAVCRLEVQSRAGLASGTGFRISANRVLTNWHVLYPDGQSGSAATATFGYEDGADGVFLAGVALACDLASIAGDSELDWAVVNVGGMPDDIPILPIDHGATAALHAQAFVIQHPGGQRKRVAYARNKITFCDDRVVQYLSDTQGGSSGSPVIDAHGRVIALHHAGGQPQDVAGQAPLKKNEGIAIARVSSGIRKRVPGF